MQAIILIGGLGTRLYPFTYTVPKSLLPIGNRPFLGLECQWLRANGVSEVVFAVSHFAQAILQYLQTDHVADGFDVKVRMEEQPLGSGGALKNCADILRDDFLLLNGDILMDMDLGKLLASHRGSGAMVTATVSRIDDTRRWGILDIQDDDRALGWQEKPAPAEAKSLWGNVGAWAMSRAILDYIPEGRFVSLEKETFPLLFEKGLPFFGHRFSGYWKDIGTLDHYVQANRDLLAGVIRGLRPGGRETSKGLWIDDSAQVADDAVLTPPVVLGPDCRVERGAHILGPTVIGSGVQVGAEARIESSIMWPDVRVGDRVTMRDCVIGEAEIGPDCVLGAGCSIASNTVVAQGMHVPAGTVFGPGSRVCGSITQRLFVSV